MGRGVHVVVAVGIGVKVIVLLGAGLEVGVVEGVCVKLLESEGEADGSLVFEGMGETSGTFITAGLLGISMPHPLSTLIETMIKLIMCFIFPQIQKACSAASGEAGLGRVMDYPHPFKIIPTTYGSITSSARGAYFARRGSLLSQVNRAYASPNASPTPASRITTEPQALNSTGSPIASPRKAVTA